MKRMLDAGYWMLDEPEGTLVEHRTFGIEHRVSRIE
jgi:predicted ATPase